MRRKDFQAKQEVIYFFSGREWTIDIDVGQGSCNHRRKDKFDEVDYVPGSAYV
jgi:hypothetical protein